MFGMKIKQILLITTASLLILGTLAPAVSESTCYIDSPYTEAHSIIPFFSSFAAEDENSNSHVVRSISSNLTGFRRLGYVDLSDEVYSAEQLSTADVWSWNSLRHIIL